MRPARTPPSLLTLILSSGLAVLSLNMFLPSLAKIAADFGVPYALANLSIAGYLVVLVGLQILFGPLSDRFGRRPVMLWSTVLFVIASVGCLLAETIWVFLAFRMLQGSIVAGQILSRAAIRDMYPPKEAASKLGYVTMAMALAPMLGPMLGGVLDMVFGWRASFALYTGMGALLLVLVWGDMGETNTQPSATFAKQLSSYPELFASRRFWGYSLCAAFAIGGFYAFITGAPIVASAWYDLSPAALGVGIGIITAGFFVGNFVTGRLAMRVPLNTLILIGRIVAVMGPGAALAVFALGLGSLWVFFGAAILVGFGNGLTVANATTGLMSVRPHLAGSAAGLSGALTVALGAALASATGVVVNAQNAPFAVLGMMLGSSVFGLVSILYVRRVDRCDPLSGTI